MTISTVSPKYQVVIPKEVRQVMKVQPGQKYHVMAYDSGRIELIPLKSIKERIRSMKGILKGIDTTIERGPDRV